MEPEPTAHLERTVSQLSATSATSTRSGRGQTVRAKSKNRPKVISQTSSSASSIAASDKSLTSFPSFSPEAPRFGTSFPAEPSTPKAIQDGDASSLRAASTVESLASSETQKSARNALFEDSPIASRKVPGALHLASDEHIERLIARHGAVPLLRQVAEDLAHRDAQITDLRRKADERERALRKIILQCGLSNLDLETRLRSVETEIRAQDQTKRGKDRGLTDMMNDAMQDSVAEGNFLLGDINEGTIRANNVSLPKDGEGRGTTRGWKEWLLGTGTSKRNSRASSINGDAAKITTTKGPPGVERRPTIREDLFNPPDTGSMRSSSRASSTYSTHGPRKPSSSLASMALQLVAGKATSRENESNRGRSNSAGQATALRAPSTASAKTSVSARAVSSQVGPRALMAMRRTTTPRPLAIAQRSEPAERWDTMEASPGTPSVSGPDNYGPVEMDTIFSPEGQPPTLSQAYNCYDGAEYLTDRFGFIYDQRRKKRQREAAAMARKMKRGGQTEMLTGGRLGMSPSSLEETEWSGPVSENGDRPDTPNSGEDGIDQGRPRRWQDYLKVPTYATELLSHTPSITATGLEVHEGTGTITSDERGFVPAASTTSAVDSEIAAKPPDAGPAATLVKEDVEPVKILLQQLSEVHDKLQREKAVRWNEFLRKVRAERRREGEAAAAAAAAEAQARYQKAPLMIPEAKLADGEVIGIADLGVKGKVGRAKWNEFRNLVLGGIPVANRPKIWSECSGATNMRIPGQYDDLVSRSSKNDDPQVVSQIQMDITRTLTDNIFFRKGPGVAKLKEVLLSYSRRNPDVGYCQGMNLIAANLLLIMPSPEDTFWILTSIVERILPEGYYDHSLMASRADQHVLRQYVTHVLPRLSQHLEELSIELEALTFQWFLSVFTDCLSAEALFRVWDVVLCTHDGSTFLFQVALALLKLNEQQLLQCTTPAAVYTYINHQMTNHAISIDGLIQASEGLRRLIRREDVEERRIQAIEADKQLMKEREAKNQARRAAQKAASAPILMAQESSASAVSGPSSGPVSGNGENGDVADLNGGSTAGEDSVREEMTRTPMPAEEEARFALG